MMSLEVESPTTYAISQNDLPVPDWDDLVESVRLGFPTAQQELDHVFRNGLRLILARRVPASLVEEKIRQVLLAIAETKVLYMSGYAPDAVVHRGRLDPAIDFVEKPFTGASLIQRLRELLDTPRRRPSS